MHVMLALTVYKCPRLEHFNFKICAYTIDMFINMTVTKENFQFKIYSSLCNHIAVKIY